MMGFRPLQVAMLAVAAVLMLALGSSFSQAAAIATPTPTPTPHATATPNPPAPVSTPVPMPVDPSATPMTDTDVPNGHFFTQASGFPRATSPKGFAVTDEADGSFWSEFRRLGGVDAVGYPVSRRFGYGGFTLQAMQKGVMQWRPEVHQAWFVNVFDLMHEIGKDDWLLAFRSVPRPLDEPFDKGKTWDQVMKTRWDLLEASPAIKQRYWSVKDPLNYLGLPTSKVEDMGNAYVIRLQRAVIQQWKVDVPWAKKGDVTVANGGDVAKEAGLFPEQLMRPQMPPDGILKALPIYKASGKSTWYGQQFQGSRMANGQAYDLNDATTTASNMYPLSTKLKVTNTRNGQSVIVVVKDTGAFLYPVVTDLSYAAFGKLDNQSLGLIDVNIELVP